jgi:hypothetical protein
MKKYILAAFCILVSVSAFASDKIVGKFEVVSIGLNGQETAAPPGLSIILELNANNKGTIVETRTVGASVCTITALSWIEYLQDQTINLHKGSATWSSNQSNDPSCTTGRVSAPKDDKMNYTFDVVSGILKLTTDETETGIYSITFKQIP